MKLKIIANKLLKLADTLEGKELLSPPIDTILSICEEKGITKKEDIKNLLKLDKKSFYKLMTSDLRINKELAKILAEELGFTPDFWVTRDNKYFDNLLKL